MNKKINGIISVVIVLLFAVSLATVAGAWKPVQRFNEESAYAEWITPDQRHAVISVVQTYPETYVNLEICSSLEDYTTCKLGYFITTENVLTVSQQLDYAFLNLSSIEINDFYYPYGNSETLNNIQVQWKGIDKIAKSKDHYIYKDEGGIYKSVTGDISRIAEAIISVNNTDFSNSTNAGILRYKTTETMIQK